MMRARTLLICFSLSTIVGCRTSETDILAPWRYDGNFSQLVENADRIVVRDGGLDCCGPVDSQKVLAVIEGTAAVKAFTSHIVIETNQTDFLAAAYCGYPGIDWYKRKKRIALTAVEGGGGVHALRWKGFPRPAFLTKESREWLTRWLLSHGITT